MYFEKAPCQHTNSNGGALPEKANILTRKGKVVWNIVDEMVEEEGSEFSSRPKKKTRKEEEDIEHYNTLVEQALVKLERAKQEIQRTSFDIKDIFKDLGDKRRCKTKESRGDVTSGLLYTQPDEENIDEPVNNNTISQEYPTPSKAELAKKRVVDLLNHLLFGIHINWLNCHQYCYEYIWNADKGIDCLICVLTGCIQRRNATEGSAHRGVIQFVSKYGLQKVCPEPTISDLDARVQVKSCDCYSAEHPFCKCRVSFAKDELVDIAKRNMCVTPRACVEKSCDNEPDGRFHALVSQAKVILDQFKDKHKDIQIVTEKDMFKNLEQKYANRCTMKSIYVKLSSDLIGGQCSGAGIYVSQTYSTRKKARFVKKRIVDLFNMYCYDEGDCWVDHPAYTPKVLFNQKNKINCLLAVLTGCIHQRIRPYDVLANECFRPADYEGATLHDVLLQNGLEILLPIGCPERSTLGSDIKKRICEHFGYTNEEYAEHHSKVQLEYSRHFFVMYRAEEFDIVKDEIMKCVRRRMTELS